MTKTRNTGNLTDVVTAGTTYPTSTTPPQFDNSTNTATTAFVATKGIQASSTVVLTGSTTLTAAHIGTVISVNGTGPYTLTLPLATGSNIPAGSRIEILNSSVSNVTLQVQGSDHINAGGGTVSSMGILPEDSLVIYNFAPTWVVLGGTTQLEFSGSFKSVNATAGYQVLPSGMIMQYGNSLFSTAGVSTIFPIAFPGQLRCILLGCGAGSNTIYTLGGSVSGFTALQTSATPSNNYWAALGF